MSSPVPVYVGDDWQLQFSYAVGGSPFDLSAYTVRAELFQQFNLTPTDLTIANGGVTITNAHAGLFSIFVARAVTALVKPDTGAPGPNRIQIILVDNAGHYQTLGVQVLQVIAP